MANGAAANVLAKWHFNRRWRTWIPAVVCVLLLCIFLPSARPRSSSQSQSSESADVGKAATLAGSEPWWEYLNPLKYTQDGKAIAPSSAIDDSRYAAAQHEEQDDHLELINDLSQHQQDQHEEQNDRLEYIDFSQYQQDEHEQQHDPPQIPNPETHTEHEQNGTDAAAQPTTPDLANPYDESYVTRHRQNHQYSRTLVVARTQAEKVDWVTDGLPESDGWQHAIYTVNDEESTNNNSEFHIPANKGNEAMVYLSYIIDHYDTLADISIFLHAHDYAIHNDNLLSYSSLTMLKRLSSEKVMREGYMNLRCEHDKTCSPGELRPYVYLDDPGLAQRYVSDAFNYFAPETPLPEYLTAPCCGQFAVTRDMIRRQSKTQYQQMREWLMSTSLSSFLAGRVFEYTWHYILTGEPVACPSVQMTYCDAYSICFEDEIALRSYFEVVEAINNIRVRLDEFSRNEQDPGGRTAMLHVIDNELQPLVEQKKEDAFRAGADIDRKRQILYNGWERIRMEKAKPEI